MKLYSKITLSILLLFMSIKLMAQDPELSKIYMEQADQVYAEAKDAIEIAKDIYIQAAEADTMNVRANYMAGKLYLETVNRDYSTKYFERVKRLDSKYRFNIDYLLGRGYQYGLEFEKALDYFLAYKEKLRSDRSYRGRDKTSVYEVNDRIEECRNAKEIIGMPSSYIIENVSENINSTWPDYAPVLNEDETVMIFTSRRQEGNMNENVDNDNFYFEDIYISKRQGVTWSKAKNIGPNINTLYHDSNLFLSSDGKTLYIYSDQGNGDIVYSTENENDEWTKPKPLEGRINSQGFAEQSIWVSDDGEFMMFASNRPGGYGGFDIYGCYKEDGQWKRPFNMGPEINTKEDEDGPYMAKDGVTVYFSSKGHKGFGGFDVFTTKYDGDSEKWEKPENLGYPVNTVDDEVYFHPTADGERGYLASVREEGLGFTDIYMVTHIGDLEKTAKDRISKLKERDNDFITDEELEVKKLIDSVLNISAYQVYFDVNSSEVAERHEEKLIDMANFLKSHQNLGVQISAFASADGNPKYNYELSNKRAQSVLKFFKENGIEADRLAARGFGVLSGGSEDKSRKAEVKVLDLSKFDE
ncbi:OmpA family protein [Marivirga salinae]|uniref:OmpA family protein n=1 Tax=Marivirga salinarum TaxID=3059078 RepID=A0AA49J960_9BACT|nr:OmpA family protein [Marivirga sp. BDSF4-3]WKK74642.2 OmpA family protein [Marivirga sp. BDSF4-3]